MRSWSAVGLSRAQFNPIATLALSFSFAECRCFGKLNSYGHAPTTFILSPQQARQRRTRCVLDSQKRFAFAHALRATLAEMNSRVISIIAVVSTTLLVGLLGLMIWGAIQPDDPPPHAVYSLDLELDCPADAYLFTHPVNTDHGVGWVRGCFEGHGPALLWRDGKLVERGQYVKGNRHGIFVSYSENGGVIKETRYVDGNAVP
jgi:hypothetical protein